MSEITTEQRLQLVQQIREIYRNNKYDMRCREQILYGNQDTCCDKSDYDKADYDAYSQEQLPASSLKGRMILAFLVFMAIVILNENGIKIAGITSNKIIEMISADYEAKVNTWVETISK